MSTTTKLQLRQKVIVRLKDPNGSAVTPAVVDTVIDDAIRYWKNTRFWFNEFKENVTLTANNPVLPAISGITILSLFVKNGIVINYAQSRYALTKVLPDDYDAMNVEGRGIPYAWTYRNKQYELYYYPDAAYTAVVRGLKDYDDLAEGGNNDFTNEGTDLIMYEVLSRLFGEFRMDAKMETYYTGKRDEAERKLIGETNKRNKTGRNQVEG